MIRLFLFIFLFMGCQQTVPKPKAQLGLEYPIAQYVVFESSCPYSFAYNQWATPKLLSKCGMRVAYPKMKGTLFITYFDLKESSLDTLFRDFEKRLELFGKQASRFDESAYENKDNNVIGSLITLIGDSPSNLHFFGTDSKQHFVTGSLLFDTAPNYDSLAPAIGYLQQDVRKLLESLRWN
ncbi:MAG: gliding motility lipoprotein GldD [Flavobacteriaceae bacterium]|jgi:gliding motility-associated lipoprotein GldD